MKGRLAGLTFLLLSACASQVEVSRIETGDDFSGLTAYERQEFEWAAVAVVIPADTARLSRRWQLSNVSLNLSRCEKPDHYYPADARMGGTFFDPHALEEQSALPVTLIFYVPKHVQQRERYGCATLDARGYSPVFLTSETMRLPAMRFKRFQTAEQPQQSAS